MQTAKATPLHGRYNPMPAEGPQGRTGRFLCAAEVRHCPGVITRRLSHGNVEVHFRVHFGRGCATTGQGIFPGCGFLLFLVFSLRVGYWRISRCRLPLWQLG